MEFFILAFIVIAPLFGILSLTIGTDFALIVTAVIILVILIVKHQLAAHAESIKSNEAPSPSPEEDPAKLESTSVSVLSTKLEPSTPELSVEEEANQVIAKHGDYPICQSICRSAATATRYGISVQTATGYAKRFDYADQCDVTDCPLQNVCAHSQRNVTPDLLQHSRFIRSHLHGLDREQKQYFDTLHDQYRAVERFYKAYETYDADTPPCVRFKRIMDQQCADNMLEIRTGVAEIIATKLGRRGTFGDHRDWMRAGLAYMQTGECTLGDDYRHRYCSCFAECPAYPHICNPAEIERIEKQYNKLGENALFCRRIHEAYKEASSIHTCHVCDVEEFARRHGLSLDEFDALGQSYEITVCTKKFCAYKDRCPAGHRQNPGEKTLT